MIKIKEERLLDALEIQNISDILQSWNIVSCRLFKVLTYSSENSYLYFCELVFAFQKK